MPVSGLQIRQLSFQIEDAIKTELYSWLTTTSTSTEYEALRDEVFRIVREIRSSSVNTLRVLITVGDGTVVIDTGSDPAVSQSRNTYEFYRNKTINENHNTRVEIMKALQSDVGSGTTTRFSTSDRRFETYLARRMGLSSVTPEGVIRVSVASSAAV